MPGERGRWAALEQVARRDADSLREVSLARVGLLAVRTDFPLAVVVADHARPGVAEC